MVNREEELIGKSFRGPVTVKMLNEDFQKLGLRKGMALLVHASLSSLGWVCGDSQAVVTALQETLTAQGTLLMPTYTGRNSDPAQWRYPPVPPEWIEIIREHMPAYHPQLSPTRFMGEIVETFRSQREILRSSHPRASFAAWGEKADFLTANHPLDFPFGENSPLTRAYDVGAHILLLGVSYNVMNSWYLSAFRSKWGARHVEECRAVAQENGKRVWKTYLDHQRKHDDFEQIGREFEATGKVKQGLTGHAQSKLMSLVEAVDFATAWMDAHRQN